MQTSAKTGQNVDESFLRVTKKLMEKKDEEEDSGEKSHRHPLRGKKNLFAGGKKTASADGGCCN